MITPRSLVYKIDWEGGFGGAFDCFGRDPHCTKKAINTAWAEAYDAVKRLIALLPDVEVKYE